MWPARRHTAALVAWSAFLGPTSALNYTDIHYVPPTIERNSYTISETDIYNPDNYDCPLSCVDYANMNSWVPYLSVDRLNRCKEPMLLQYSVTQPLNDPTSNVFIRSCSLESQHGITLNSLAITENPKKAQYVAENTLESSPACSSAGTESKGTLELVASSGGTRGRTYGGDIHTLLKGMRSFFDAEDNCDEKFLFAYHNQTAVGIFIGAGLGKLTVESALTVLNEGLQTAGQIPNRTVAQLCSGHRGPDRTFGVSIDATGNLAAVQKNVLEWSTGKCASDDNLRPSRVLPEVKVWDIVKAHDFFERNRTSLTSSPSKMNTSAVNRATSDKSATCRYIRVESGNGCAELVTRCGISPNDLTKFNPKPTLCSSLMPGDYICCSAGEPYVVPKPVSPVSPKPNADGTCATHLIVSGDTCYDLATKYGVTVQDLENWNKGRTWAWTECKDLLLGYNMCISAGDVPLPPPQAGTACGPVVPGTLKPKGSYDMKTLNPCPNNACCSNWGYCGVFPGHCDVHSVPGGGPGAKPKDQQNTCVSNCGTEIKQNSGPPLTFQRIGYYESFNLDRECLWLRAKNANTDGSYTHIHWAFANIDPSTWKPVINDTKKQWNDFKALGNVKRIVSFGGWAYSTEPATFNIIRSAIIRNGDAFVRNLAQFVRDEGIDGIDIDWEYPGAPDIMVNGKAIGEKGDGDAYLSFLNKLKTALGPDKSVSIAAPASYWYLRAFPIQKISTVIDYIVYMTYDLHGQWDYGNPNSFDKCDSGKCIRSHVNLTETRNSLSIITKAGVANNKIFVGEASYGRSFHMANPNCWGPMCDFTGTRDRSDANPGRCTKTGGYVAYAEVMEILKSGDDIRTFHDKDSNSDVIIHKGDYISYMTPTTKDTRREDWKKMNFAGTIDWAVDLQSFGDDDLNSAAERPKSGNGCRLGRDISLDTWDLCEFSCHYGFCPETLCTCRSTGPLRDLPPEKNVDLVVAFDESNVEANRLCKFACKYGYCPPEICTTIDLPEEEVEGPYSDADLYRISEIRQQNWERCLLYKDPQFRDLSVQQCKEVCKPQTDAAIEEGRTTNYGCLGFYPGAQEIPWTEFTGTKYGMMAPGKCVCDNWLINELVDTFIEALPAIAQIGCYIIMSSFKFVLDLGAKFIPVAGKAIDAGLDMMTVAAQLAAHAYPDNEDPEGAFSWWLRPCGGTNLVPDEIKKVFEVLSNVGPGVSSFKKDKTKVKKGSGKKGDAGNPKDKDRSKPRNDPDTCPREAPKGSKGGKVLDVMMPCVRKQKPKCRVPPGKVIQRYGGGKEKLRERKCVNDITVTNELIVTSVHYAPNPRPIPVKAHCEKHWNQACYFYSYAIRVNPQWATITCPQEAATNTYRFNGKATSTWSDQHSGEGWLGRLTDECDRDEYPPAHLLNSQSPAWIHGGKNAQGQLVRFLPAGENRGAGSMWKGSCLGPSTKELSDAEFIRAVEAAPNAHVDGPNPVRKGGTVTGELKRTVAMITVNSRPEFSIGSWGQSPLPEDGLLQNPCWPQQRAPKDPGFVLLNYDPWYAAHGMKEPPYKYNEKMP